MAINYSMEDVRLLPAIISQVFQHPLDIWQETLKALDGKLTIKNVILELLGCYVAGMAVEDCYKKQNNLSLVDLIFSVSENQMPIYIL
jgi:hypothetical protein